MLDEVEGGGVAEVGRVMVDFFGLGGQRREGSIVIYCVCALRGAASAIDSSQSCSFGRPLRSSHFICMFLQCHDLYL